MQVAKFFRFVFLLLVFSFSSSASALILVEFESTVNFFNPGPLPKSEIFRGSFKIDDSVTPSVSGGLHSFNGAIDDFQATISGQTFGGTNGRLRQFTNGSGVGGFMTGTLNNTFGSTFGTYTNAAGRVFDFTGMNFDWRSPSATLFPGSDPALISSDLLRDASQNDFDYALMNFSWAPQDGNDNLFDDSLRIRYSEIKFTCLSGSCASAVPEPNVLLLFMTALGFIRLNRRKQL